MVQGKNVIITGARRGIGRAATELFAENGANIWACARIKDDGFEDEMQKLAERCGVWIKPLYFDLIDEEQTKEVVTGILKEKLPIDVLINNAGEMQFSLLQMTSLQMMKDMFQINFFSQMLVTQLVSRMMIRQRSGSIVNISSFIGLDAEAGGLAYGASKASMALSVQVLSKELAGHGIRVNAVAPGLTETDMLEYVGADVRQRIAESVDMRREGSPREIAEAIMFLASDKSSYITGQVIRVDGGM